MYVSTEAIFSAVYVFVGGYMRIWIFDSITGELIPSSETDKGQEAPESPREKGKFLEIKYSTTTRAPEYGEHEIPVFDGTTWDVKKDFRDIKAWYKKSGEKVTISEIGIEPDSEYVEIEPEGIANPIWDFTATSWREKTELEVYDEAYAKDPEKTVSQYASLRRAERDRQIRAEQDMIDRHANEVAEGETPTESNETISKRRKRIKALRDVPDQATFPRIVVWP
jgi:hypothetical protein